MNAELDVVVLDSCGDLRFIEFQDSIGRAACWFIGQRTVDEDGKATIRGTSYAYKPIAQRAWDEMVKE